MSAPHPSSGHGNGSWPQTVAYSTATWGGGMSVAPQLIEGGRAQSLECRIYSYPKWTTYVPALTTLGSELLRTPSRRSSAASWSDGREFSGSCIVTSRNPLIQKGATTVTKSGCFVP